MMQLWDEGCRNMTSPYLLRPLRGICQSCKERIAREETGICESCYLDAQANVVDLNQERATRHVLKIVGGDEG